MIKRGGGVPMSYSCHLICSNCFYLQQLYLFCSNFLFAACPLWATVLSRGKRKSFCGKLHLWSNPVRKHLQKHILREVTISDKKGGTYELFFKYNYIHKSRLLKKWRGNYIYMKQDFLVTSFWLPTLSTVKYSSRYFILYMVFDNLFLNWLNTCA